MLEMVEKQLDLPLTLLQGRYDGGRMAEVIPCSQGDFFLSIADMFGVVSAIPI